MRSLEMQFADVEIGMPRDGKKPARAEPVHSQELQNANVEVAEPPAGQSLGLVLVPAAAGAALGAGLSFVAFRRQRRQLAQALYQQ